MRPWIIIGSIFAFSAVLIGAMGAHALKPYMDNDATALFNTANQYQMWHALALILTSILENNKFITLKSAKIVSGFFVAGILLFSGNLYVSALVNSNPLHFLIPVGGGMFLLGWLFLIFSFRKIKN